MSDRRRGARRVAAPATPCSLFACSADVRVRTPPARCSAPPVRRPSVVASLFGAARGPQVRRPFRIHTR
jgi:hypothetical protein